MVSPLTQNTVKAYCLGFMLGLGVKARQTMLTKDENIPDKDLIFRTAKNGKKIAINTKTKEVSGVGPDQKELPNVLTSFSDYKSQNHTDPLTGEEIKPSKLTKNYMNSQYKDGVIHNTKTPLKKGVIEFNATGRSKTAFNIRQSELKEKASSHIPEIYREGELIGSSKPNNNKHSDIHRFFYFKKDISENGENITTQLDLARLKEDIKKRNKRYLHYSISKADKKG